MLAVMLVGSIVAALAVNVPMLFVGRIIQGVTGPVVPICLLMLRDEITDPKRYGAALGLLTAVNGGIAGDRRPRRRLDRHELRLPRRSSGSSPSSRSSPLRARRRLGRRVEAVRRAPGWTGSASSRSSSRVGALLTAFNEAGKLGAANPVLVVGGDRRRPRRVRRVLGRRVARAANRSSRRRFLQAAAAPGRSCATTFLTMTGVFAVVNGLVTSLAQNGDAGLRDGGRPRVARLPHPVRAGRLDRRTVRRSPRPDARLPHRAARRPRSAASSRPLLMAFVGVHSLPVLVAATVLIGITYAGIANIMLNGLGHRALAGVEPRLPARPERGCVQPRRRASASPSCRRCRSRSASAGPSGTAGYSGGMLLGAAITIGRARDLVPHPPSGGRRDHRRRPQKETVR